MFTANAWTVFVAAFVTAVATGIGAAPFLFVREMSGWWLGVSNAIAAGGLEPRWPSQSSPSKALPTTPGAPSLASCLEPA